MMHFENGLYVKLVSHTHQMHFFLYFSLSRSLLPDTIGNIIEPDPQATKNKDDNRPVMSIFWAIHE
jgi:hypothetical protein